MEDLHDDLRLEIFSRLPPEAILKSKLVCKTWKNPLSHQKVGLLFLIRSYGEKNLKLYYGDYGDIFSRSSSDEEFTYKSLTEINHPVINRRERHSFIDQIVGSCNGLVCFRVPHHHVNDPVYICNPITTEYINLPRLKHKYGYVVSGFGYDPPTNKYKVIRIHYPGRIYFTNDTVTKGFVDIYTLGSGSGWRSIGEVTYHLSKRGVLANGSIYWLDYQQKKIVAFDLADEKFRWLPTVPQCFNGSKKMTYRIIVLGGNLCLVHHEIGQHIDIWAYKKMQKNDDDDKEKGNQSWGWTLEFTLPSSILDKLDMYEPFALTKNNEVLLWLNESGIYCYDKKTETLNEIVGEDDSLLTFQGIPHMNNLISLKALGEKFKSRTHLNKDKKKPDKRMR
ncbi:hypothetical protein MKX01_022711 [Papaver californicum]|nr:hypothetical protein MKX01_022711 [Papaver californicum]